MIGSLARCTALATLIAMGCLQVVGCSGEESTAGSHRADGRSGDVRLSLVPVTGVTVNAVNYVVTGAPSIPGTVLPSGVIPTPGNGSTVNFGIPVPVGTGYTISLSAVSAEEGDNITCTGSHGPFDVTPNQSSSFGLTLTCVSNGEGSLAATVDVKTNACPRLSVDFVTAIPWSANVGRSLALNASARDLDGKPVTYQWSVASADAGVVQLSGSTTAAATAMCASSGINRTVTVTASNGECTKLLSLLVSCGNFEECGNGVLDAGELCDPSIPATQPGGSPPGTSFGCPADCSATCGDGLVEAPVEQCELPAGVETVTCTSQCRLRPIECGDGILSVNEPCDGDLFPVGTPSGSTCSSSCQLELCRCGDGVVSPSCGEECDPGNTPSCSNDCQMVVPVGCVECEATTACAPFANACLDSVGTSTAAAQALCYDVAECIQDSNCADGASTFSSCYCGTLSNGDCAAAPETGPNAPHGPCAALMKAGSTNTTATATNVQVLSRMTGRAFPSGAAVNRFNCLKNNAACSAICGF